MPEPAHLVGVDWKEIPGRERDGVEVPRATIDALASSGAKTATIGIRPEHLHVEPDAGGGAIPTTVSLLENLGSETYVYGSVEDNALTTPEDVPLVLTSRSVPAEAGKLGSTVHLGVEADQVHVFHPESGERVG